MVYDENEPMSALTHFIGFLLALAGLILLVIFAVLEGTVWHVVGFTVFGVSCVLLYLASTIYHFLPVTANAKRIMRKVDHAMIYVLIAGTYTPICLITLRGAWGWTLFSIIWALAISGIVWKSVWRTHHPVVSTVLYVLMGWLVIIAFIPLREQLSLGGFLWLLAGGLCYTVGAVVFGFDHIRWHPRWFGMHDVWHLFVIAGSFCHFWLMLWYVL